MGTPQIPGADRRRRVAAERTFLLHRLGQLEAAYRETAGRALLLLDPASDEAASVRRVLLQLEG